MRKKAVKAFDRCDQSVKRVFGISIEFKSRYLPNSSNKMVMKCRNILIVNVFGDAKTSGISFDSVNLRFST